MKIVFIGAGNVATHLSVALKKAGHEVVQIYSRTMQNAQKLASILNTECTTDIKKIVIADLYIYALSDSALSETINQIQIRSGIHIHTAGSVSIEVFESKFQLRGVMYPLQTFSKEKEIDMKQVPIFIEGSEQPVTQLLTGIVSEISNHCYVADSEKRMKIHISAVFACNFTNYFYQIAYQLTKNEGISFDILKPLIIETATKINNLTPFNAQTGPARRNDQDTVNKHLSRINDKELHELYKNISDNITRLYFN